MSKRNEEPKLPDDGIIRDPKKMVTYQKGKFLGKGGFAKVYELTCRETREVVAGKIVPKTLLQKGHQRQKMQLEISIHKALSHKHIVKFFSHFEDDHNVYIILEICRKRTLMELHRRRKTVTEPEARYFMRQICESLSYLHGNNIVHRDLKLGNLLLNDDLQIKVGDFGLAARIGKPGDRKMTMCGTPNYIAPEVLLKEGHSYEVDIWALGCILYTLLVGHPPFETENLNETYSRIKKNKYSIPANLEKNCPSAVELIKWMLRPDPSTRPTIQDILASQFLQEFAPSSIPSSCLTMAPRTDTVSRMNQTALMSHTPAMPLQPTRGQVAGLAPAARAGQKVEVFVKPAPGAALLPIREGPAKENESGKVFTSSRAMPIQEGATLPSSVSVKQEGNPFPQSSTDSLAQLQSQLQILLNARPKVAFGKDSPFFDDAEDPSLSPMLWISRWVDYSDKYGLGYQLSDDSFGVLFNDKTRLILLPNQNDLHYVYRDMREEYHTVENFPPMLTKKVKLIKYFRDYMNERLVKAGAEHAKSDGDELARYPYMVQWYRTQQCILMHLSNGTIQMNYFTDHVKIILCPVMQAVTYLHGANDFHTYSFSGIRESGCTASMYDRLKDAYHLIQKLMSPSSSGMTSSASSGQLFKPPVAPLSAK